MCRIRKDVSILKVLSSQVDTDQYHIFNEPNWILLLNPRVSQDYLHVPKMCSTFWVWVGLIGVFLQPGEFSSVEHEFLTCPFLLS